MAGASQGQIWANLLFHVAWNLISAPPQWGPPLPLSCACKNEGGFKNNSTFRRQWLLTPTGLSVALVELFVIYSCAAKRQTSGRCATNCVTGNFSAKGQLDGHAIAELLSNHHLLSLMPTGFPESLELAAIEVVHRSSHGKLESFLWKVEFLRQPFPRGRRAGSRAEYLGS